jgi:hypothetical protein
MAESPTVADLFKAKALTDNDILAAVDAYMADPHTTVFMMGQGYGLNLAEAVRSREWTRTTVASAKTNEHVKRHFVRTAILLARPEKR